MSNVAIKVEGLGKKYQIGHQVEGDLRSSLVNKIKGVFGKTTTTKEDFWALQDVSFEVKQGEAVGIIGRNGAGKSTLLKILARITDPTSGRFEINGRVSSLLEVGTGFHQELTGRENIFLNGTILGMKRKEIKAKFDEIVAFSGVEKFIDTPVKHYSSGMKVRLAFSVAAHLEPEILIIDEVLAVGDAEFQQKCLGKMDEVSKNEGRTVLFVSHNMSAIENLCTRCVLLEGGSVSFVGKTDDALSMYLRNASNIPKETFWINVKRDTKKPLEILDVKIRLEGKQPFLRLEVVCTVCSNFDHQPCFIAFDVLSDDHTPLFQSIPTQERLIKSNKSSQLITSFIDLPPLIPGAYWLSVWLGPQYYETYDWKLEIVSFTIDTSPIVNRTHPHSKRNGFLLTSSTLLNEIIVKTGN